MGRKGTIIPSPATTGPTIIEKKLSWVRLPSEETEDSDWQIDVRIHGNSDAVSYLVHRDILSPKSMYFKAIFRLVSESQERRSTIDFPADVPVDLCFGHFERVLDWFYSEDCSSWEEWYYSEEYSNWEKYENLSLLYLANFFGFEELKIVSMDRMRKDLLFRDKDVVYPWIVRAYRLAKFMSIQYVLKAILWACLSEHEYFCEVWKCIQQNDSKRNFLHDLYKIRMVKCLGQRGLTQRWHELAAYAIRTSPDAIDENLFILLTQSDIMTEDIHLDMDSEEAIIYLKHEQRLDLDQPQTDDLTPLQEACIRSIVLSPTDDFDPQETLEALGTLKPSIRPSLFLSVEKKKSASLSEKMKKCKRRKRYIDYSED